MNLITFGFSEKGTPVFLNEEPFPQVGTLYLMKAGKNSVIGITLDDNLLKPSKAPDRKPRKATAEKAGAAPKKRGRRAKAEAIVAAPKKRGRKSKTETVETAPKKKTKKPGKPKTKKEKPAKKAKAAKVEVAV